MQSSSLTSTQEQVIALLSAGSTVTAAAAAAGIHRNTIANWRRSSSEFRQAFQDALMEKAELWRERVEQLVGTALQAIRTTLMDPETPASVRLKAALTILAQAAAPVPPSSASVLPLPAPPVAEPQPEPAESAPSAQSAQSAQPAQSARPLTRSAPKTGRNESCPCGSGRKFKRCCLGSLEERTTAAA